MTFILYARSTQTNCCLCISVTPEEVLLPIPAKTQTVTKPEAFPSNPKPGPLLSPQAAPVLIPHRPPPKVPMAKKPVPLQRVGVKSGHASLAEIHTASVQSLLTEAMPVNIQILCFLFSMSHK